VPGEGLVRVRSGKELGKLTRDSLKERWSLTVIPRGANADEPHLSNFSAFGSTFKNARNRGSENLGAQISHPLNATKKRKIY